MDSLSLEQELDRMLEMERFPSPAEFRERASWSDPAIYEEAAADAVGWWTARSKELLDLGRRADPGPRRLEPALLQVVRGRPPRRRLKGVAR